MQSSSEVLEAHHSFHRSDRLRDMALIEAKVATEVLSLVLVVLRRVLLRPLMLGLFRL